MPVHFSLLLAEVSQAQCCVLHHPSQNKSSTPKFVAFVSLLLNLSQLTSLRVFMTRLTPLDTVIGTQVEPETAQLCQQMPEKRGDSQLGSMQQ